MADDPSKQTSEATPSRSRNEPRVFDLVLAVVAVLAMGFMAWQLFMPPKGEQRMLLRIFDDFFCLMFFIDYIRLIVQAKRKWRYIFTWGLLDLASSIPNFGPARFLRIVRVLRLLRVVRSIRILSQVLVNDRLASTVSTMMLVGLIIIAIACFGVLHFETGDSTANIRTAEDVAWWAVVTTSTVGYGDLYPVTPEGRLLAVLVMCVGIGLFATFAGALAGILIKRPRDDPEGRFRDVSSGAIAVIQKQNAQILERLDAMEDRDDRSK